MPFRGGTPVMGESEKGAANRHRAVVQNAKKRSSAMCRQGRQDRVRLERIFLVLVGLRVAAIETQLQKY